MLLGQRAEPSRTNEPIHIPQRFRRALILHVVCNLFADVVGHTPLLLGIDGPPGTGKTFQCERVLEEMRVDTFHVAESELENEHAGRPAERLRGAYEAASTFVQTERARGKHCAAALIINDIDTGLGDWGELVQTTVNRQLVIGELMHLADYPNLVGDRPANRIPIIVTGNDFTKLYKPLLRRGRMRRFPWHPTSEEMVEILRPLFPTYDEADCRFLIEHFPNEPVGFFVDLRRLAIEESVWNSIAPVPPRDVIASAINNDHFSGTRSLPRAIDLVQYGKEAQEFDRLKSHLEG